MSAAFVYTRIVRFAVTLVAVVAAAAHIAADDGVRSVSGVLHVSATVVSSCRVATSQGRVDVLCAHSALGPVRVNGKTRSASDPRPIPPHAPPSGSLITIDF